MRRWEVEQWLLLRQWLLERREVMRKIKEGGGKATHQRAVFCGQRAQYGKATVTEE